MYINNLNINLYNVYYNNFSSKLMDRPSRNVYSSLLFDVFLLKS